jgi:DNA-nicking Smr family endonuclease
MADDIDIDFKQAMRGVRPLNKDAAPATSTHRGSNRALREQIKNRARHSAAELETTDTGLTGVSYSGHGNLPGDESLFFLSSGVQKKVLRELKKGSRYTLESSLDLHGLNQRQAQREIDAALLHLAPSRLSCLLIIHGKGLHSAQGATLKEFTATYLKTLPSVKAYCSAQPRDGGSGALYVLAKG